MFAIELRFADPQLADGAAIDQGLMHQGLSRRWTKTLSGCRPATEPKTLSGWLPLQTSDRAIESLQHEYNVAMHQNYDKGLTS